MDNLIFKKKCLALRQGTLKAFVSSGEAHLGGSFSCIEILVYLYYELLSSDDIFILSKSHSSFPLCLLLRDLGYEPPLTTHLELDEANGIFATTGSLGHGFPIAVGRAVAKKIKGCKGKVYCLVSDGECQEGTTWESSLLAAKFGLDNLVLIVDYNKIQALDFVKNALPLGNIGEKFEAFGFSVLEVDDGHNFGQLERVFRQCVELDGPVCIVLHTIKGKGIPEFENDPIWHAKKIRSSEDIAVAHRALGLIDEK